MIVVIGRLPVGVQAPTGRSVLILTCAPITAVPLASLTVPCTRYAEKSYSSSPLWCT